ncbi:tRNA-dihydrouridine(20a/20b) synthase [NAD(P)(+)] [Malassezia equina]|uniref:tRNA-dihydrouridine synthase n=1 Tax=Malassezia equina TaxID=1381935 RepID=A0AAF0ECX1_9BASI|nr:tRNA-dihydrouridine(20a/20b) synthase [NAD(P)(+)] [Malassezia equina]
MATAAVSLPPHHLLSNYDDINVCAPMVRYSKLPFRALVAQYDTHITTTPMILATEFSRHPYARDADFSTNATERGEFELHPLHGSTSKHTDKLRGSLVCQLAASEPAPLADAAELVSPFVDGIDLNCGPQPWAYAEHIGSYLLRQPETVADMVRAVKGRLGAGYCVSVKIRIDTDLSRTNTLICNALHAGASLITVHGRTRHQSSASDPVNLDAVKFAIECANACGLQTARGVSPGDAWVQGEDGGAGGLAPCVVNGDIWTRDDAQAWRARTGARGAMSARGLLANPALFSGASRTPPAAVADFVDKSLLWGLPPALLQ